VRGLAGLAARAALLATTTFFLLATAGGPKPGCGKSAEVTFKIAGSCGPSGLIIVSDYGQSLTVENATMAGIPATGSYEGSACPPTLAKGGWTLSQSICLPSSSLSSSDGGDGAVSSTDAAGALDGGDGASPCVDQDRSCAATVIQGQLWLTCTTGQGSDSCSAQLTVVE
jgi:hypothetical protein